MDEAYFAKLQNEHGITLTKQQRWWYCAKRLEQGDDMLKEFPSTPDEAFEGAMDGAVFGRELQKAPAVGQESAKHPYVPGISGQHLFGTSGLNDAQTIWLHQVVAGQHNFIGYYENSHEALATYFNWMGGWRSMRSAVWGQHYAHRMTLSTSGKGLGAGVDRQQDMAAQGGIEFETVKAQSGQAYRHHDGAAEDSDL